MAYPLRKIKYPDLISRGSFCNPGGIEYPINLFIASIEPQTAFAVMNFLFSIAFQNEF
jgi:hypothetical protein